MPDITLTVDFTQVNSLNTTLKSTDTLFVKVVDSLLRESQRADRVTKAFANTTQDNLDIINKAEAIVTAKLQQESDRREKLRVKEAARAEKEAQKLVDANNKIIASEIKRRAEEDKNAAAYAQNFQAQVGPNLGLGAQGISAGDSASAFGAGIEELRLKYDQIYASSQLYERSLAELNTAHLLGILSENKHKASVESLNQEYQNFQNGIVQAGNRFSQYTAQSAGRMNQFGVVTQQAGYQIGDFLVQVQSGTNWMVALGQQATQLVGILPLMGAGFMGLSAGALVALSAGLGIAIPLVTAIGAAFMRTSGEAKNGKEGLEAYASALKGLQESLKQTQVEIAKLSFGVEDPVMAAALKAFREAEANLEVARANQRRIGNTIAPTSEQSAALREAVIAYTDIARLIRDLEEKQKALAEAQQMLNGGLSTAAGIQKGILYDTTVRLRQQKADADAQVVAQEELNKKLTSGKNLFHALAGETESVSIYLSDALRSALGLANVDFKNIKTVADYLAIFQGQMGRGLPSTGGPTFTYPLNADTRYGPSFEQGGRGPIPAAVVNPTLEDLLGGTGNEGGTGPAEATQTAIEKLQEQLAVERELIGTSEAYQKVRQALGEEFSTTSPQVIAGLVEQATQVERLIDLEKQREQVLGTVKSSMEDTLMSIVDGTKSAKDAFKTMAAEIIKELYRVYVVQQLVNSVSGFIMPSKGPAGSVPRLSQAQPRAAGGSMMANMAYMVGEKGPELVIPRHSGTVVNAKQTANAIGGGGSITVQNNITVTGSDAAMVRTEVAKMIPQITNATKAAVLDAKQRGGQFAAAFR